MSESDGMHRADRKEAYDRGQADGRILERLEGHDAHFSRINGSVDRLVGSVDALTRVVAAQGAGQDQRDAAVKAAAEALAADAETKADALETTRADRADALASTASKWQPIAIAVGVCALILTAIGLAISYF